MCSPSGNLLLKAPSPCTRWACRLRLGITQRSVSDCEKLWNIKCHVYCDVFYFGYLIRSVLLFSHESIRCLLMSKCNNKEGTFNAKGGTIGTGIGTGTIGIWAGVLQLIVMFELLITTNKLKHFLHNLYIYVFYSDVKAKHKVRFQRDDISWWWCCQHQLHWNHWPRLLQREPNQVCLYVLELSEHQIHSLNVH